MIKLSDIVVKFGDFEALHNINVHVKKGEFFTFLGPSGCGKTTTLRTITGFIDPVGGTVEMQGQDITHVPIEKRNIGIVFQSYALFPTMTVRDNIAFGLKIKKQKKEEIDRKVNEIARKVDLTDEQLAKAVSQLSGGQQQRVAIARALVTEPAIICMDEPLSNLDAKLRVNLRNELKKMQREFGITTIYVTHDQEEALTLSDRIAVFNKGYIEQIGTPNEVYNHSKTEFVANFIGDINKLQDEIVNKLGLPAEKVHYIRLERIGVTTAGKVTEQLAQAEQPAEFQGVIESQEYYGLFIKYTIQAAGQALKVVEKNDGINIYEPGDSVIIRINPADIMSY
jgi:iron(III) transport system ATP-binding protein